MKFSFKKSDKIAFGLWMLGVKYSCSSFEGMVTYGYGKLDDFGFWQYQLVR